MPDGSLAAGPAIMTSARAKGQHPPRGLNFFAGPPASGFNSSRSRHGGSPLALKALPSADALGAPAAYDIGQASSEIVPNQLSAPFAVLHRLAIAILQIPAPVTLFKLVRSVWLLKQRGFEPPLSFRSFAPSEPVRYPRIRGR